MLGLLLNAIRGMLQEDGQYAKKGWGKERGREVGKLGS
jgi:hypothetical protein